MRRSIFLAALLVLLAAPARAHAPAQIRVAAPSEGAQVEGGTVRVVLVGEGGDSAGTFGLELDGQAVDATGKIGGVFTTLGVRPNEQVALEIDVTEGEHTLTLTPTPNLDGTTQETVVRRFSVVPETPGGGAAGLVFLGVAVAVAVGAAVAVRRKAAKASV